MRSSGLLLQLAILGRPVDAIVLRGHRDPGAVQRRERLRAALPDDVLALLPPRSAHCGWGGHGCPNAPDVQLLTQLIPNVILVNQKAKDEFTLPPHLDQLFQQVVQALFQPYGGTLHRVVNADDVLHGERLVKVRQALHKVVNCKLAVAITIEHCPSLAELINCHVQPHAGHGLLHAGVLHHVFKLFLVEEAIAVTVSVIEALAQELNEGLLPPLLLQALQLLAVRCGRNHLVRGHASKHGNQSPGGKGNEDDKEQAHYGVRRGQRPSDVIPIVLRNHSEECED
mmetsp:Transcript_126429/g.369409  ORF Transcript_126429/g.369409 Transcript_126429/m.369409 type:complete len:284 (-) Transcript_126429:742-1593(-)